jgi:hypothetical protein
MARRMSSYPENSDWKTVEGYVCRTCNRYWGEDKNLANYCCSDHSICKCGNKTKDKSWAICEECLRKRDEQRWEKAEEVDWNGETPLCLFNGDKYFFCIDSILCYLEDNEIEISDLRLELCEAEPMPVFSMYEFLEDYLPEDMPEPDGSYEIEQIVNKFLDGNWQPCYMGCGKKISEKSKLKYLSSNDYR